MKAKNINGFTLIEVMVSLSILAVTIIPLMSMLTLSARINRESSREFKSLMEAQRLVEEFKSLDIDEINEMNYKLDKGRGCYEKYINQTESEYGAMVRIIPDILLYRIEVFVLDGDEVINYIEGSRIVGDS